MENINQCNYDILFLEKNKISIEKLNKLITLSTNYTANMIFFSYTIISFFLGVIIFSINGYDFFGAVISAILFSIPMVFINKMITYFTISNKNKFNDQYFIGKNNLEVLNLYYQYNNLIEKYKFKNDKLDISSKNFNIKELIDHIYLKSLNNKIENINCIKELENIKKELGDEINNTFLAALMKKQILLENLMIPNIKDTMVF